MMSASPTPYTNNNNYNYTTFTSSSSPWNEHHPNDIPYRFSFIDMKRVSFESTVMIVFLMVFVLFGLFSSLTLYTMLRLYNARQQRQHRRHHHKHENNEKNDKNAKRKIMAHGAVNSSSDEIDDSDETGEGEEEGTISLLSFSKSRLHVNHSEHEEQQQHFEEGNSSITMRKMMKQLLLRMKRRCSSGNVFYYYNANTTNNNKSNNRFKLSEKYAPPAPSFSMRQRLLLTLWVVFWLIFTPTTILSAFSEFPVYVTMIIQTVCCSIAVGNVFRAYYYDHCHTNGDKNMDKNIDKNAQQQTRMVSEPVSSYGGHQDDDDDGSGAVESSFLKNNNNGTIRSYGSTPSNDMMIGGETVDDDGSGGAIHFSTHSNTTAAAMNAATAATNNRDGYGDNTLLDKKSPLVMTPPQTTTTTTTTTKTKTRTTMAMIISRITSHLFFLLLTIPIVLFSATWSALYALPTCQICFALRPFTVSSAMTRYMFPTLALSNNDALCEWNTICRTYFTVTEDISRSMIVNFHTHSHRPTEAYVLVQQQHTMVSNGDSRVLNENEIVRYNATFFRMSQIPGEERYQYWADLTQLTPDSSYVIHDIVVVFDAATGGEGRNLTLDERHKARYPVKFRTGPDNSNNDNINNGNDMNGNNNNRSFAFVSGGDMEWGKAGISLSKYAASQSDILFAVLGGDIAYENAIPSCYMRYDEWFYHWSKYMRTSTGHAIPILTTIGNHEAGGWRKTRSFVPFYFDYFPHQIGIQGVDPSNRRSYHNHMFGGHTSITILDSYVVTPIIGEQKRWLMDTLDHLNRTAVPNRLAVYHASAFPAHLSEIRDITSELRNHYVPLFEQYDVKAVYEHHYHCLANSHPIRNGRVDPRGVRYLGQGSWGVSPRKTIDVRWWSDDHASVEHVLYTRCNSIDGCTVQTFAFDQRKGETGVRSTINLA